MAQQGGGGQQGQGGGGANESLDFLWVIVLLVVVAFAVWYFYHEEIARFIFFIRLYEVKFIRLSMEGLSQVLTFLTFSPPDLSVLKEWESYIGSKPEEIPLASIEQASIVVSHYFAYPVAIILIFLGLFVYRRHITLKFKMVFGMLSLKKAEQDVWPQSKPTLKKDLVAEDIKKGPWAMAMSPIDFCEKHKIVLAVEKEGQSIGKLMRGPAYRVFALQTGRLWPGAKGLTAHAKALIAIFAAKGNHDTDAANKLLDQISGSAESDKLNFSGVQEMFNKYYPSKAVQEVIARHAYLLTVMASLLELARTDGVLASAEFIWLKPIDRPLWYILNSVGRRAAVPEVAGVFAHWLAEKELKAPVRTPMVESAVKAMEAELENTLYEPTRG